MTHKTDMQATFEHWVTTVWRPGDGAKLLRREYPRMALAAWEAAVVYIESKIQSSYEEAEREHLGDPDAKTGIYSSRPDAQADERGAFEEKFAVPDSIVWRDERYHVLGVTTGSHQVERFCGRWDGWQARASMAPTPQQISDYLSGLDAINRALVEREARAAAPQAEAAQSEDRIDALQDMAFANGLQLGWNFGSNGAREDYEQALKARDGYVRVLRETRAAPSPDREHEVPCAKLVGRWDYGKPGCVRYEPDFPRGDIPEGTPVYVGSAPSPDREQGGEAEKPSDDVAVDAFASAMKAKMAEARAKGRGGWEKCDPSDLSRMLREHVEKGDPRDVANFCMMLWHHSAQIASQPQAAEPKRQEEQPSFTNPLTPYGMLVRALRIVAGTTLYDMAKALLTTPAKLSAMEFGRAPVTQELAFDVAAYFDALGVPDTLAALTVSANARALLANGE